MRIGIDISQIVYEGTGVGRYVRELVKTVLNLDKRNRYVLFGSSLRQRQKFREFYKTLNADSQNVSMVILPIPPTILELIWNKLHIIPIEWFIGTVDVFWSSDWTQPPLLKAKGITTVHDLSFFKFPESFAGKIIEVQKRRLKLIKKECKIILCDSETTKLDIQKEMGIEPSRLRVVYPGF